MDKNPYGTKGANSLCIEILSYMAGVAAIDSADVWPLLGMSD